eukprot:jgi/Chlat1/8190/Chrsp76S07627
MQAVSASVTRTAAAAAVARSSSSASAACSSQAVRSHTFAGRPVRAQPAKFTAAAPTGRLAAKSMGFFSPVRALFGATKPAGERTSTLAPKTAPEGLELATVAGGCFWGLELALQRVPGVVKTSVGYTQGRVPNPMYEEVCSGSTGHTEAVQVTYNPQEASYEQILSMFFSKTDPTTLNRQGNDMGTQYRSGIYFHTPEQEEVARAKLAEVEKKLGKKVVAELKPAGDYYFAEDYHQQYLEKGGRFNRPQSAAKGCNDPIRCYG